MTTPAPYPLEFLQQPCQSPTRMGILEDRFFYLGAKVRV